RLARISSETVAKARDGKLPQPEGAPPSLSGEAAGFPTKNIPIFFVAGFCNSLFLPPLRLAAACDNRGGRGRGPRAWEPVGLILPGCEKRGFGHNFPSFSSFVFPQTP